MEQKLVVANQSAGNAILYNFNNLRGEVSNDETFLAEGFNDNDPYGLEFSVDSKKLYISTVEGFRYGLVGWPGPFTDPVTYKLFQYDLTATNIPGSQILIHEQTPSDPNYPEGGFRGALQLAPNGKIYATIPLAYEDPASFCYSFRCD